MFEKIVILVVSLFCLPLAQCSYQVSSALSEITTLLGGLMGVGILLQVIKYLKRAYIPVMTLRLGSFKDAKESFEKTGLGLFAWAFRKAMSIVVTSVLYLTMTLFLIAYGIQSGNILLTVTALVMIYIPLIAKKSFELFKGDALAYWEISKMSVLVTASFIPVVRPVVPYWKHR